MREQARSSMLVTAPEGMEWRWLQRYLVTDFQHGDKSTTGKAQDEFGHVLWVK